jgi:hypothetical protein
MTDSNRRRPNRVYAKATLHHANSLDAATSVDDIITSLEDATKSARNTREGT